MIEIIQKMTEYNTINELYINKDSQETVADKLKNKIDKNTFTKLYKDVAKSIFVLKEYMIDIEYLDTSLENIIIENERIKFRLNNYNSKATLKKLYMEMLAVGQFNTEDNLTDLIQIKQILDDDENQIMEYSGNLKQKVTEETKDTKNKEKIKNKIEKIVKKLKKEKTKVKNHDIIKENKLDNILKNR